MRRAYFLAIAIVTPLSIGCDSLGRAPKYDNPVLGPPPPRLSYAEPEEEQQLPTVVDEETGEIRTVALTLNQHSPDLPLADSQTVAVVNGTPILAAEVLERYGNQLAKAKAQIPPEEFNKARLQLIKRDLDSHIERMLLAEALRVRLQPEQSKMLEGALDEAFAAEVQRMMKEAGVNSRLELEKQLLAEGTSLENLRTNFAAQQMAMEYLRSKAPKQDPPGRPELLAYYEANKEKYFEPSEAKWRQIVVDVAKQGGKDQAEARLNEIIEFMRPSRGANFAEAAKKFSDGPNAAEGGAWSWTTKGSLADSQVDEAIFELPVGQPSQVLRKFDEYKIVLVDQRKPDRYKPFEDVQDDIAAEIERESRKGLARGVIDELRAEAEIMTIFDQNVDAKAPKTTADSTFGSVFK